MTRTTYNIKQGSLDWLKARASKLCSSEMSKAITPKKKQISTQITQLVIKKQAALLSGEFEEASLGWAAERGTELEPLARMRYEEIVGVTVEKVGFMTYGSIGASTDGLTADHVLEIKCLTDANHLNALIADNPEKDYWLQVQTEMYVADHEYANLYFFHPTMPSRIVTVEYDPEFTELLLKAEEAFNTEWLLISSAINASKAKWHNAPELMEI